MVFQFTKSGYLLGWQGYIPLTEVNINPFRGFLLFSCLEKIMEIPRSGGKGVSWQWKTCIGIQVRRSS